MGFGGVIGCGEIDLDQPSDSGQKGVGARSGGERDQVGGERRECVLAALRSSRTVHSRT